MSSMRDDCEEKKTRRKRKYLSSGDQARDGSVSLLKKGPWTSEEDRTLAEYVRKHGEGNWNAIRKRTELARCGKSCRLRWTNHLRPDLKKGPFTPEEERLIIEMHATMGNKWARMAMQLPGRTDNEIKNYWNTREKRLQRAGMPLYPEDVRRRLPVEGRESQDTGIFSMGTGGCHLDLLPADNLISIIPDVDFKDLGLSNQAFSSYLSSAFFPRQVGACFSNNHISLSRATHQPKHPPELETSLPLFSGSGLPPYDDSCSGLYDASYEPFTVSSVASSTPYIENLQANNMLLSDVPLDSQASLYGNPSSLEPLSSWAPKMELPSLQYSETQPDSSCGPYMPPHLDPLQSESTQVYSPHTEQTPMAYPCPRSSGLDGAVDHMSQARTQNFSTLNMPNPSPDCTLTQWEVQTVPNPPFRSSAASVSNAYCPVHGPENIGMPGHQIRLEPSGKSSGNYCHEQEMTPHISALRPDALLDQGFFRWSDHYVEEQNDLNDDLLPTLDRDFGPGEISGASIQRR